MLNEVLSYFLYSYSLLYQAFMPCSIPQQLPANSVDRQQVRNNTHFDKLKAFTAHPVAQFSDL